MTQLSFTIPLQAVWRGFVVRRACGAQLAQVRLKLASAAEAGRVAPHKRIGVRMREALGLLLAKKEPERVCAPMLRVAEFTAVSRDCCFAVAKPARDGDGDGRSVVVELLQHLRRCNRSKPHEATLRSLLGILANMCRYAELLPAVFRADDCVETLSEKLQMFRDTEVGGEAGGAAMANEARGEGAAVR